MTVQRLIGVLGLAIAATLIHGCTKGPPWNSRDISGLMPRLEFNLTDESGKSVNAAAFRGKIVMLFFGYTHCPDYCPTTLSRLAKVLEDVPNERSEVRVLFVSVDPKRDSPNNLAIYTDNFAPEVIGLTGTQVQLRELAKRYRTTFSYGQPNELGNYTVSHGLAVYVFDGNGNARLMILQEETATRIAADVKRLADEQASTHPGLDVLDRGIVHQGLDPRVLRQLVEVQILYGLHELRIGQDCFHVGIILQPQDVAHEIGIADDARLDRRDSAAFLLAAHCVRVRRPGSRSRPRAGPRHVDNLRSLDLQGAEQLCANGERVVLHRNDIAQNLCPVAQLDHALRSRGHS